MIRVTFTSLILLTYVFLFSQTEFVSIGDFNTGQKLMQTVDYDSDGIEELVTLNTSNFIILNTEMQQQQIFSKSSFAQYIPADSDTLYSSWNAESGTFFFHWQDTLYVAVVYGVSTYFEGPYDDTFGDNYLYIDFIRVSDFAIVSRFQRHVGSHDYYEFRDGSSTNESPAGFTMIANKMYFFLLKREVEEGCNEQAGSTDRSNIVYVFNVNDIGDSVISPENRLEIHWQLYTR